MSTLLGNESPGKKWATRDAKTLEVLKEALNDKIGSFFQDLSSNTSGKIESIIGKLSDSPVLRSKLEDELEDRSMYAGSRPASAIPVPISAFYFSLFAIWFAFLCRRVWAERRKTRVYYGDGTSELSYALGGRQLIQSSAGNSSLPAEENVEESKEHAWRIENLRKLVKCVEARDSLLANAAVSAISLLMLEFLGTSLNLLHLIGMTHLLSSIILCERGIIRPSTRIQGAMLAMHWSALLISSALLIAKVLNLVQ